MENQLTNLSIEAKEAIVAKTLLKNAKSIPQIAKESGVGYSTLARWVKNKQEGSPLSYKKNHHPTRSKDVSSNHIQHILATANLDNEAIGIYCRTHGIHAFQLQKWQEELMSQDSKKRDLNNEPNNSRNELKKLREENKNLKKDLRRKEKALAETSALLILKKKAHLIWGDQEDD